MEYGAEYTKRIRKAYPGVPGRADLVTCWYRKAHDHLGENGRAGLVGTNSIRQNNSREGSLDYIVAHGGMITDAVSTQVWSGDAAVHVSIVNWIKGEHAGEIRLVTQMGDSVDSPWKSATLDRIGPSLSAGYDVTSAKSLAYRLRGGFRDLHHLADIGHLSPVGHRMLARRIFKAMRDPDDYAFGW